VLKQKNEYKVDNQKEKIAIHFSIQIAWAKIYVKRKFPTLKMKKLVNILCKRLQIIVFLNKHSDSFFHSLIDSSICVFE
jgi:hypothetical protein